MIEHNNLFSIPAIPINKFFEARGKRYSSFLNKFDSWIHSSDKNVNGLPPNKYLTTGVTDVFDKTYIKYNKIGIFPGEYSYHIMVLEEYLDESRITYDLTEADIIIVSHPFSADGLSSREKLQLADSYNKPILVDCAYFGACSNISFDFTPYKNIVSVAFSLSKVFGTGSLRIGLLYTKDFYPYAIWDEWSYQLHSNVDYHYNLIDKIGPDDLAKQFKKQQLNLCDKYKLQPSDTVLFGLDNSERYTDYKRHNINRICLSKLYKRSWVTVLYEYFYKLGFMIK
jgi:hypothetical protein